MPSETYSAEMVCVPCVRAEVVRLATPLVRATGEFSGKPSAKNRTVPAGERVQGATADRLAAKVTFEPLGEGLAEEMRVPTTDAGVIVNWPGRKVKL